MLYHLSGKKNNPFPERDWWPGIRVRLNGILSGSYLFPDRQFLFPDGPFLILRKQKRKRNEPYGVYSVSFLFPDIQVPILSAVNRRSERASGRERVAG